MIEKLPRFARRFLDKKTRTLYKAGFIDKNLELTDEGRDELEFIVLEQNMDKMVEAAQKDIDEEGDEHPEEE